LRNKFDNFTLRNVRAIQAGGTVLRMNNVLVDVNKQRMIYCSINLPDEHATSADSVECKVLELPMTLADDGVVEISHHTLTHKLNSGHYKKCDYEQLGLEMTLRNIKHTIYL